MFMQMASQKVGVDLCKKHKDPVIKDSEGFCVPLRTLEIVRFWYTANFTLLVTRTAELVIQFNWLNGQRAPGLNLFLLRPQCNGHQAALLRPQLVGWHNGHQATILGWFDLQPQRVSSIKHTNCSKHNTFWLMYSILKWHTLSSGFDKLHLRNFLTT